MNADEMPPTLNAQIMGFANAAMQNAKAAAENAKVPTVPRCLNCAEIEIKLKTALDERDKANDVRDELTLQIGVLQTAKRRPAAADQQDTINRLQAVDRVQRDNIWNLERFQELLLAELRKRGIPIPSIPLHLDEVVVAE